MATRVSVINFKGGVGKTTLAFHLATGLARYYGSRVLLVDMDHQSSLSIVALGGAVWDEVAATGETVTRVFRNFLGSDFPGRENRETNQLRSLQPLRIKGAGRAGEPRP